MTSLRMTHTLHLKCESNTLHKWSSMQTRWSSSHQNETLFAPASPPNTAPPPFPQSYAKVLTHFTLLSRRRAFCAPFSWLSHAPPSCNVCVQTIKLLVVCCYCGLLSPFFYTPTGWWWWMIVAQRKKRQRHIRTHCWPKSGFLTEGGPSPISNESPTIL